MCALLTLTRKECSLMRWIRYVAYRLCILGQYVYTWAVAKLVVYRLYALIVCTEAKSNVNTKAVCLAGR